MNEKRTAQRRLFHGHGLFALFICIAAAGSILSGTLLAFFRPEASTQVSERTLTFPERVAYQRAIEEVYWRNRIWPKDNPQQKPPLAAIVSEAQLERKVEDYLRKSQLVTDQWQSPITASELQAEMKRMAAHTKQPEVLRELFEALGNDPFVIAECLARPAIAERLVTNLSCNDRDQFHTWRASAENQMAKLIAAASPNYKLPTMSDAPNGCTDDTWTATSTTNAPSPRHGHTAVWTGTEMIVWGGVDDSGNPQNTGGRYNPSTDTWSTTGTTSAPDARASHTAVWTGTEMIVWGGNGCCPTYFNTGGRYNPATDSWTATSTANAPDARLIHTAVWTGSQMIVWGGQGPLPPPGFFNTGGRYNPSTDSWTATSTINAPAARAYDTAVWTGSEMIVWGGSPYTNTGGRYEPGTDSWTATSLTNAPEARGYHTAVWTGSEMIVWGGSSGIPLNTGGRYNPGTNTWTATPTTNVPSLRFGHTALWTGNEMILWGGFDDNFNIFNTGGRYNPGTNSWIATSISNAPEGRFSHRAVWTGSEMIVWGGIVDLVNNTRTNTGGRYCAQSGPTPTATPTSTATPTPTSTATATATPTSTPRPSPTARPALTPRPRPTPPPRP